MSETKAVVWLAALMLLAFVLFSGEFDIVDSIRDSISCPGVEK